MGRPKGSRNFEPSDKRFDRYVDKTGGEDACWLWLGGKAKKGYGTFSLCPHQDIAAHVFAWMCANDWRKPTGKVVMHTCDNRACVNPKHLKLGTIAQNQKDMARKWRTKSKLTPDQVREIRASDEPYRVLAARYGLKSHKTISEIKKRRIFAHLD